MTREIIYRDQQDDSTLYVEPMEDGTVRFNAHEGAVRASVDLTADDVALFIIDLRDVAGIVAQKRETRPCGCPACGTGQPRCAGDGCPLVPTYRIEALIGPARDVCHDHFDEWSKGRPV